jgi:hypothetical protein
MQTYTKPLFVHTRALMTLIPRPVSMATQMQRAQAEVDRLSRQKRELAEAVRRARDESVSWG